MEGSINYVYSSFYSGVHHLIERFTAEMEDFVGKLRLSWTVSKRSGKTIRKE